MKTNTKPELILFASDSHGVYIPQYFAKSVRKDLLSGISDETLADLLAGPDAEFYWDSWDSALDSCKVTDENGNAYTLYQDGDLWLVPVGMEWNETRDCWEWPFEGESFTGPECWASYLINGDDSGIDADEKAAADKASEGMGACVDAIECGYMSRPDYGLAGNCCEYRFLSQAN